MRRLPTLLCALGLAWSLGVPAAAAADAAPAATGNHGIASALAAVGTRLTQAALAASPSRAAASGDAADIPAAAAELRAPRLRRLAVVYRDSRAPRPRRLAVVRRPVGLGARPGGGVTLRVGTTTEFGSPRVLAVAARRRNWLGVIATERPNNRLAWVRRGRPQLRLRRTRWSLYVDLSARRLTLRKAGRRVRRMTVAIGRPGSETPTGRFAVTDKLGGSQFGPYYGCCILALSGHQPNTPPGWTGGNRLAIHGTDAPSTIGTAASAGCLRAADGDLRVLMARVPLGTQVFIRR